MASIPCAAYQASHIHGNIRKQTQCRSRHTSGTSSTNGSAPNSPVLRKKSFTEAFVNNVIGPFRKSSWQWPTQNGVSTSSNGNTTPRLCEENRSKSESGE